MEKVSDFVECIRPTCDDDFVDRLHYFWTCLFLAVMSSTIFACQVAGNPVQCWMPREYTEPWENYVERNCFMENIYQLQDGALRKEYRYYPWVPFLLACQSFLFYLPHLLWTQLNVLTGIRIRDMITRIKSGYNRRHTAYKIADQLYKALRVQDHLSPNPGLLLTVLQCGRSRGIYISVTYLCTKALYLTNSFIQWLCLNRLFGTGWFHMWGLELLRHGILKQTPQEGMLLFNEEGDHHVTIWNALFPRVLFCSLQVRNEENKRAFQVTLQCVLWINMVNEKVFLCLWWWLVLLNLMTSLNTAYWLLVTMVPTCKTAFVSRYLRSRKLLDSASVDLVSRFVDSTIKLDGIYVLRVISANASDLYATDVVEVLWWRFQYDYYGGRRVDIFKEYQEHLF